MLKRKIYVVGRSLDYANWMKGELTSKLEEADLVVFTGGEDVTPDLYNEPVHPRTSSSVNRDKQEVKEYSAARSLNKKMIGICRGSQLLCVLAGGKLVQHQDNPLFIHPIETIGGQTIEVTSSHHQAQYPYILNPDSYKLLAWTKNLSKYHEDGYKKEIDLPEDKEAEIVLYPKINALGIQGHPEWMFGEKKHEKSLEYLNELLDMFMENTL